MTDIKTFTDQYINGAWVPSTNTGKFLDVFDSSTDKVVAKVPDGSAEDANAAVAAAHAAFEGWAATPLATRKALVQRIVENYMKVMPEVATWLSKELGCPPAIASKAQAPAFVGHMSKAIECIDQVEWEKPAGKVTVVKEPIGVVGAITPWNWPLNQIALKIGPALLAGCTVVLKPSEITPVNAYLVTQAIHEAGLPKGVFNMVCGTGLSCGETLAKHPDVDMISFTGSTRAGKRIQELAATSNLKSVRTELGGKSAAIFLDDADFKQAVPQFMGPLVMNCGQSCNALTRMLVPRSRLAEAEEATKAFMEAVTVGRGDDKKATMGPLVSKTQWDKVQGLLQKGVEEGAKVVIGGPGKPTGLEDGYFVKPTVFSNVTNNMAIARDEIFGPVLSVLPYDTEEEAVKIANDTIYGLNNAVASADEARAMKVARQLRSGMVMINTGYMDGDAPFGGYKQSGNAREWGIAGVEEFLITKTINLPFETVKSKL
eukprot:TRINITY_DN7072_c0_g1_i1.p1 TRINITY_DN7072_c0_g1~~TRINITY_DN7072_c0_g1_i1.p1  ORF type:complete len:494 (+),score=106.17 TRINITY_DN7072_c0_g1_i1:22-1482(+)